MRHNVIIDHDEITLLNAETLEPLEAIAVIPDNPEDLAALVARVPPEMRANLARLALAA